ncbi:MAG: hypothetical protein CL920_30820 [Deltaproteobacteria bacterium]|nr:hypothetical protein [Deltaproteobacteria bacterium]
MEGVITVLCAERLSNDFHLGHTACEYFEKVSKRAKEDPKSFKLFYHQLQQGETSDRCQLQAQVFATVRDTR